MQQSNYHLPLNVISKLDFRQTISKLNGFRKQKNTHLDLLQREDKDTITHIKHKSHPQIPGMMECKKSFPYMV